MTTAITTLANLKACSARLAVVAAFVCCGCQQKMAAQPSYKPLDPCDFFADGGSARPQVAGTVARGQLRTDIALYTGGTARLTTAQTAAQTRADADPEARATLRAEAIRNADFVTEFPIAVSGELVQHGRDRFNIYCAVCHDAAGTGRGKIVERGYTRPPSYHIDRLRAAPVGHLFAVISEGYGSMPSYAEQIPVRDRWAIVAYIRALQLSQHFPVARLDGDETFAARCP